MSHYPSEIIIICWFSAQETFLIIISVENRFLFVWNHVSNDFFMNMEFKRTTFIWNIYMSANLKPHSSIVVCIWFGCRAFQMNEFLVKWSEPDECVEIWILMQLYWLPQAIVLSIPAGGMLYAVIIFSSCQNCSFCDRCTCHSDF